MFVLTVAAFGVSGELWFHSTFVIAQVLNSTESKIPSLSSSKSSEFNTPSPSVSKQAKLFVLSVTEADVPA